MELQESNVYQADIDKYLAWYESITNELPRYRAITARLKEVENKIESIEGTNPIVNAFLAGLSDRPHTNAKFATLKILREEQKKLNLEIKDLLKCFGDLLFVPPAEYWELLKSQRTDSLQKKIHQFTDSKSTLSDANFAIKTLNELIPDIEESPYYAVVTSAMALPLQFISDAAAEFNPTQLPEDMDRNLIGWSGFTSMVCDIDFAKWLYEKTKGIVATIMDVALLYHYLEMIDGESLHDDFTAQNAANKYNVHIGRLRRNKGLNIKEFIKPNTLDKNKKLRKLTTNERKEKLKNFDFVISELMKIKNKSALQQAKKDKMTFEKKLNELIQ